MGDKRFAWAALASAATVTLASSRSSADDEVVVRETKATGFVSTAKIEASPREVTDLASLLEPMPGVHVRRLGPDDSFSTLSIRGSASTQVAVYLAGVPLSGGADPTLDLATLPLWPGVRARVFRSFAPATLGPGSLGGTLAIDPPAADGPLATEVWGAVGSFGARRMRVADVRALDDAGRARVVTALSASRSDDDFSYFDPLASSAGREVLSTRTNAGHAAVNGLASVELPAAARWRLTTTVLAQMRRQELPGTIKAPTPGQKLESDRLLAALELVQPVGAGDGVARVWGRREGLHLRDDPRVASGLGPTRSDDAIVAAGASLGWRGPLSRALAWEVRAEGTGERFAPGTWVGALAPPAADRASFGAATSFVLRPDRDWALALDGRADFWNDASSETSRGRALPTGHAGVEHVRGPVTLASHVGFVARPPSFVELYGNRGAFLGNASLQSESAVTADLGARWSARGEALRAAVELVGFATWADDLIVFVYEGAFGRARASNIGRSTLRGVEASARVGAGPVELHASYTGLATANASECAAASPSRCERPPLPGRPEHDLYADLGVAIGFLRLRYGLDVVAGTFADRTGTVEVPPRALQSAGLRADVPGAPGLRLALDVRNLFDVRTGTYDGAFGPVREPLGDAFEYPLPGRSFLLSARFVVPGGERRPP
jgi:hypothetical protein